MAAILAAGHNDSQESLDGGSEASPPTKVAAINPAGHCVMLPVVSDVVRHLEKHPKWHIAGGSCPEVTPTPGATPTSTLTPRGPGTGHGTCSEATSKASARLRELKGQGRPVDVAIEALLNCGNGGPDDNGGSK